MTQCYEKTMFLTNRLIDSKSNLSAKINKNIFSTTMLMNFYEIIILFFHFANLTKTTFKRFFNDVINIVNNVSFNKRDKKTKYRKNSIFVSQSVFYNFIFFQFVIVRFRQKIRRSERLASRVFFCFSISISRKR